MSTPAQGKEVSDPGQMIGEMREQIARLGGQVRDYVQHRAQEVAQQTSEAASQVTETAESYVRERPMTAVAVAAGSGLLIGLMLMRARGSSSQEQWMGSDSRRGTGFSRRDIDQLAEAIQEGFDRLRPRGEALTDRLAGMVSSWLENSGARASEVASAGTRTARRFAERVGSRLG